MANRSKAKKRSYDKKYYRRNKAHKRRVALAWRRKNKIKYRAYQKKWQHDNPEKVRTCLKRYRKKNKKKLRNRSRAAYAANPAKANAATIRSRGKNMVRYRASQRRWWKKNIAGTPRRLRYALASRIRRALKRKAKKAASTETLLGATVSFVRSYLSKLFLPGMAWANYGKAWHIDHIRPCASFNLTDPAQQRVCFHYSNLQPLWIKDNIQKGDKW